jgi:hypothetical protein
MALRMRSAEVEEARAVLDGFFRSNRINLSRDVPLSTVHARFIVHEFFADLVGCRLATNRAELAATAS